MARIDPSRQVSIVGYPGKIGCWAQRPKIPQTKYMAVSLLFSVLRFPEIGHVFSVTCWIDFG